MKKLRRPGLLAVRAVNQYRRRDVLTYLALRYYLENSAARNDEWIKHVATDLVLTRTNTPYFPAQHFKDIDSSGKVNHRAIFLPGANEALAEAALLAECTKHHSFSNHQNVFSYQLNSGHDRSGIFKPYSIGLSDRHHAIAKACESNADGIVLYTDIKRFYPSISSELALRAWRKKCQQSSFPSRYQELGEKIINDHVIAKGSEHKGILTGPMFSHLIANLIMSELDDESPTLPAKYFRYVDDITLVGSRMEVDQSLCTIQSKIVDMGLELHDKHSSKSIEVSAQDWLKGKFDFQPSKNSVSWMTLIGDLKRFMLANPDKREDIKNAFIAENFRIPIQDYSQAIYEHSFIENFGRWIKKPWFKRKVSSVSIDSLIKQAQFLQEHYRDEFIQLAEHIGQNEGFERKRCVPKLRYRLGRLIYLANEDMLASLHKIASEIPELQFHSAVTQAVATGKIDDLLPMGTNVAQAAAQPIRASRKSVGSTLVDFSLVATEQSLAVFLFNGVTVQQDIHHDTSSELVRFAKFGSDIDMMKSSDAFIREIACLHGICDESRHSSLLETAFDEDEDLAMDTIEQLQQSLQS